ncbi:PepSY-associated TM helix domain-containing protein [Kordiimonas pumila]|uniref:PepSY-associated TM helix domain-containing protein n=1 Tax=Kordiimonas pumila TaxID=2161677 RepID=A0ABV7D8V6_9PROT|nr:PepSY-associated TM helix domain-containing protein [Kordiimonas pumila]
MKRSLLKIHRVISLFVAVFWLVQAVTGVALVFHREIESAILSEPAGDSDFGAIDQTITKVLAEREGSHIPFVYAANEAFNSYDVYVADADDNYSVIRMAGDGTILRELPSNPEVLDAGFFELVLELHAKLWSGDTGHIIIGISGIILLSNIIMGIALAWPQGRRWRGAIRMPKNKSGKAGMYGLHRSFGLLFGVPAALVVLAGTLLAWEDNIAEMLGTESVVPTVPAISKLPENYVSLSAAISLAQAQFPTAGISVFTVASAEKPYYRIRMAQPEELRTIYGKTTLYISAVDGSILALDNPMIAPVNNRLVNAFYPLHIGEALGLIGRFIVFMVGCWILAMMFLGGRLWWLRR